MSGSLCNVEIALESIRQGNMVIVTDDESRENEGDLIFAAQCATPEKLAFMIRHTSGIICVALEKSRLDALSLPPMCSQNEDPKQTAFTVSVDAKHNTTTGISAADRAETIRTLLDENRSRHDLTRPGHVFPLEARPGGVLKRAGHTEAALDLSVMAGKKPGGVLAEILEDNGQVMRGERLVAFAHTHQIPLVSIAELIRYRHKREKLVRRVSQARLPTKYGMFQAMVYQGVLDQVEHMALVMGDVCPEALVRVHSECLTGDVLGSLRCDCGGQLNLALEMIGNRGQGALIYLRGHEGRGIGLGHKVSAYELQDQGHDTVEANRLLGFPADAREYGIGAQILQDLGIQKLHLLTNNPKKYGGLKGYDLEIVSRVPLEPLISKDCVSYLETKRDKLGHLITRLETAHA